jgi:hypothetical protein
MGRWRVGTNFYSEGMGSTLEIKEREREDHKGVGVRERISTVNVDLSGTNEEERGKLGLHMAFSVQYHL